MSEINSNAARLPGASEQPATIKVVLADTSPLLLEGLEHVFRSEPGFGVLNSCGDGDRALSAVRRLHPDVLILDLDISGKDVWTLLEELNAEKLPTRIVLMAASINDAETLKAIRLGVKGVILKNMNRSLLLQCIRKVHRGGTWLEKVSMGRAIERFLQHSAGSREAAGMLTPREFEVFCLVIGGRPNKDIANCLKISEGTVKAHLHQVYDKLGVRGRFGLVLYARDKGLLPSELKVADQRN